MKPVIHSCQPSNRHSQRGLSLIELMISIAIGLIILSAMTTMLVNQLAIRAELDKSTRMIDNGSYAMDLLTTNLRLAGFYGEFDPSVIAIPGSLPDPCSTTAAEIADALRLHVQGYNAAGGAGTITVPPCGLTSGTSGTLKSGSDILVIRRVDTGTPLPQSTITSTDTLYLQSSLCQYDIAPKYKLSNSKNDFTLRTKSCTSASTTPYVDVRRMVIEIYFVDKNNSAGDNIPTLKRLELATNGTFTTTALVEGIEYMQFDYGIDSDGDGVINSYTDCSTCSLTDWSNVVAIRVNLVARNTETSPGHIDTKTYSIGDSGTVGPFSDAFKRHAYNQVIRLNNPSGRREVP